VADQRLDGAQEIATVEKFDERNRVAAPGPAATAVEQALLQVDAKAIPAATVRAWPCKLAVATFQALEDAALVQDRPGGHRAGALDPVAADGLLLVRRCHWPDPPCRLRASATGLKLRGPCEPDLSGRKVKLAPLLFAPKQGGGLSFQAASPPTPSGIFSDGP
jgi:hypothetical protein